MGFSELSSTPITTSGLGTGVPGLGYGGYGYGGFGGTALAAGVGAAIGSGLFGDRLFGRRGGCCDDGCGCGHGRGGYGWGGPGYGTEFLHRDLYEGQIASAERAFEIDKSILNTKAALEKQVAECCCNTQGGFAQNRFDAALMVNGLQNEMAECCCGIQKEIMQNRFDGALMMNNIERQIADCCCDTQQSILKMGYETQLRDLTNNGALQKELSEIKCLIKDTEKDEIIRELTGKIASHDRECAKKEIQDCINNAFMKTSSALNQVGVNQHITAPATTVKPSGLI